MLFQLQNSPFSPVLLDRVISTVMALIPAHREAVPTGKVIHSTGYRTPAPDELIDLAIESHIARILKRSLVGGDESFFIADLGQIIRQRRRWTQNMPGIRPYYGMNSPFLKFCFLFSEADEFETHVLNKGSNILGQRSSAIAIQRSSKSSQNWEQGSTALLLKKSAQF